MIFQLDVINLLVSEFTIYRKEHYYNYNREKKNSTFNF